MTIYKKSMIAGSLALLITGLATGIFASTSIKTPLPELIKIPAGPFIAGSGRTEREAAYRLDTQGYGSDITRKQRWYESEMPRQTITLSNFFITKTLITNRQYQAFIKATGHEAPSINAKTWRSYGLVHGFKRALRHIWKNNKPPKGRDHHPVVLVSYHDALSYAAWLSKVTKRKWRLPDQREWEKAARGPDGRWFPWGNRYDPSLLNSADMPPKDTIAVGSYPKGASPYGLLDAAGNVFEWMANKAGNGRIIVKGAGAWDDKGCGVCRPAARHTRPAHLKHILIGFRLVREGS